MSLPDPADFAEAQLTRIRVLEENILAQLKCGATAQDPIPLLQLLANCIQQRTEVMAMFSQPEQPS